MKDEIKIESAEKFKNSDGTYIFPFVCLDDRKDGSSLGRIEWHLEPFKGKKTKGRYRIEKLFIFATQTRDERYRGKIFEIPCWGEGITADSLHRGDSYFHCVWKMSFCEIHKAPYFSAYPKNEHTKLVIRANSSISIEIYFE